MRFRTTVISLSILCFALDASAQSSGRIPRFGLLDSSDGGRANRRSLAAELQRSNGPSSWRATGFLLRNSLNLFSNFTYFLDDPTNGDQFEQAERRLAAGGRLTYRRLGHFLGRHIESAVGVQLRRDSLDPVGLYRTAARKRLSTASSSRSERHAVLLLDNLGERSPYSYFP